MLIPIHKKEKKFHTLRGFLRGEKNDEETQFAYSATLRIAGKISDLNEISKMLGLEPTHKHQKGEKMGPKSPPFHHDMWSYRAPVPEEEPLEKHIDILWSKIKIHKDYLLGFKKDLQVDVFLGYRSSHDHAGIEIPYVSLEMFTELQIPFGLSIMNMSSF